MGQAFITRRGGNVNGVTKIKPSGVLKQSDGRTFHFPYSNFKESGRYIILAKFRCSNGILNTVYTDVTYSAGNSSVTFKNGWIDTFNRGVTTGFVTPSEGDTFLYWSLEVGTATGKTWEYIGGIMYAITEE